jgi:hypothetical protein
MVISCQPIKKFLSIGDAEWKEDKILTFDIKPIHLGIYEEIEIGMSYNYYGKRRWLGTRQITDPENSAFRKLRPELHLYYYRALKDFVFRLSLLTLEKHIPRRK